MDMYMVGSSWRGSYGKVVRAAWHLPTGAKVATAAR
jgi:hypothetical protein